MALHDKTAGQQQARPSAGNEGGNAMSDAFARAQTTGGGQQQQQAGFSFRNLGANIRSAMGRTPTSEALVRLSKAIEGTLKEAATNLNGFEFTLIPIDYTQTMDLNVSVLVLAMRDKLNPNVGVAFHTLLVEASTEPMPTQLQSIAGRTIEIIKVVGEAFDQTMVNTVAKFVQEQFPQARLINADGEVVPRSFDLADTSLLRSLTANAVFACCQELQTHSDEFADLNLSNAARDSTLNVRPIFDQPQIFDAVGLPLRADVQIDFTAAPPQQSSQQQGFDRTVHIAKVSGFVDMFWAPATPTPAPYQNFMQPGQTRDYRKYVARFVATMCESTELLTIPAQLLALVTAYTLQENNTWVEAFKPRKYITDEIDYRDIGAVGIECNFEDAATGFGMRINTKPDAFQDPQLYRLCAAAFQPGLVISMDVPECGPQSWYNGVFAAAATGNANANQAIINGANVLTDGRFSKYFPQGGRVAIDEDNRIHLGTYIGKDGQKHDIRDIDYMAVLNWTGEKDPDVVRDWSDTFLKTQFPLAQRLSERKRIISNMVSNLEITGYATRVTFEKDFMEALTKAVAECNLGIKLIAPYQDLGTFERASAGFVGQTLLSNTQSGIFNRGGFGGTGAAQGYGRNVWNRW